MIRLNSLIYLLFLLGGWHLSPAQENVMDYNHSLKFARYLSTTRQYEFAAQEYERLHYLFPHDSLVTLELVRTYRLNRQCEKFYPSVQMLSVDKRLYQNLAFSREYMKYALACGISDTAFFDVLSVLPREESVFYQAGYYWVGHDYKRLFAFAQQEKELLGLTHPNLYQLTKAFSEQKYKSPALAGMMSALLPGSGKAYTKRWGDAVVSFLFIGTNAFAAYRAFHKKGAKSANGWIFGGLAFSFYSANIWGSVKAAKNYNKQITQTYQNNAENIIYTSF